MRGLRSWVKRAATIAVGVAIAAATVATSQAPRWSEQEYEEGFAEAGTFTARYQVWIAEGARIEAQSVGISFDAYTSAMEGPAGASVALSEPSGAFEPLTAEPDVNGYARVSVEWDQLEPLCPETGDCVFEFVVSATSVQSMTWQLWVSIGGEPNETDPPVEGELITLTRIE
jgi:hypothetical protein